jgi:hypothetical protein
MSDENRGQILDFLTTLCALAALAPTAAPSLWVIRRINRKKQTPQRAPVGYKLRRMKRHCS